MMESVLDVNIFLSPWTKFRSRDYSKETSVGVLLHRTQWRTHGRVPGARPPPYFVFLSPIDFSIFRSESKGS